MPNVRMHADEVDVGDDLVRSLLAAQFPHWATRRLRRMPSTGTDNVIFRLGHDLGVRVPRIHWAVDQIDKEHEWLPRLAPHLPAAVPEPLATGAPAGGYPFRWLIYRWLEGEDALAGFVADWSTLARDVAGFVNALHRIDPTDSPPATGRGGPLAPHDASTRHAITALEGVIDVDRAMVVWDSALAVDPWTRPPVWVHGDLLPGNVVVRDGQLAGVIDWSAAGVGDPACDAMLAWSLPQVARSVYRAALGVDDATWTRARGRTLQQAVMFIPYYRDTIPEGVAAARHRLEAILTDADP